MNHIDKYIIDLGIKDFLNLFTQAKKDGLDGFEYEIPIPRFKFALLEELYKLSGVSIEETDANNLYVQFNK